MKTQYTKKEILEICDKGIVKFSEWSDRDTPSAQSKLATIRAYLLAGCKFRIRTKETYISNDCITDDHTIWIDIQHYEFEDEIDWHLYYLPTLKRLKECNGRDWY